MAWLGLDQLEGSDGILNVPLKVLEEDGRLPLQEEIEPVFRPADFQEPVDDQDGEKDPGEDGQVER